MFSSQSSQALPAPVGGFFAVPSVASASAFVGNEGTAKNGNTVNFDLAAKRAKSGVFPVAVSVPLQLTLKSESHDVTNLANLSDLGLV
jgi:hypothetical protein